MKEMAALEPSTCSSVLPPTGRKVVKSATVPTQRPPLRAKHECGSFPITWDRSLRHKRLPPVPKFKTKAPRVNDRTKDMPPQYQIGTRITPEDVEYVEEREKYNKAVFEQWRKRKDASSRALNREKTRQEAQRMRSLAQLECETTRLNNIKFHGWVKRKNAQLRVEYEKRMKALKEREFARMEEKMREIQTQENLTAREAQFWLGGGELPKSLIRLTQGDTSEKAVSPGLDGSTPAAGC